MVYVQCPPSLFFWGSKLINNFNAWGNIAEKCGGGSAEAQG